METLFNKIKRKFKAEKYKKFFVYFSRNWLGNRIPKSLWNYHDLLLNPNNVNIFHITNNITENINRYLNNKLKKAICSNFLFRECILDIIVQFKIKSNDINKYKTKKSEILDFYIKKFGEDNINLLSDSEYKKLQITYEELEFPNINKRYAEENNGDIDIIASEEEDDE